MFFASSAKRTFHAPRVASMIPESISNPNFTKTSGNVEVIFRQQRRQLKWQVMVADVRICEMIAELNRPLATADFVTNMLIGREFTNFHYYGFVVYTCVAHTVSVAWTLS